MVLYVILVGFSWKKPLMFHYYILMLFLFDAISEPFTFKMCSFADLKLLKDLTPAETADLTQRCYKDCTELNEHLLYKGQDGPNYPQTTFTLRGRRYQMRKNQLSLFLKLKEADYEMASWSPEMSCSHLCHVKGCIKPEHLVLESYERNRERDSCKRNGHCGGHQGSPSCLI